MATTAAPRPPLDIGLSDSYNSAGYNGVTSPNGLTSPLLTPSKSVKSRPALHRVASGSSMRAAATSTQRRTFSSTTQVTRNGRSQYNNNYKISSVQSTAAALRRKSFAELGSARSEEIIDTSFYQFIEWIHSERLATLPHKGSRWDKVLIRAQYFAEQLHNFDTAIQGFALESSAAASLGYGHARLLLELGHENSEALDKVFSFFFKCSLSISTLLARSDQFTVTSEIREELCLMYGDLLTLVTDVAVHFYKIVNGLVHGSASLDLHDVFGDVIQTFQERRERVVEEIWGYRIAEEGLDTAEALDVNTLSRWLAPQDHVLASLTRDHTTFTDHQAEFTCLWFQKPLSRFVQGQNKFFLVTGGPGSGKTVLAASIAERLQRPVGRKSFTTLFVSITGGIPTHATTVNVVKSLLYQLLNLRIGDIAVYSALAAAHNSASLSTTLEGYERHLWEALGEALHFAKDNSQDLVMIIDGLDEVAGGEPAAKALLSKLITVTEQARNVKFIAFARALEVPANHKDGQVLAIDREEISDDIHAVILRKLRSSAPFYNQEGPDQERTIGRIIQVAQGSFLWANLAAELLAIEKTAEGFTKTLEKVEKSYNTIPEISLKLLQTLNPTDEAKTILVWLLEGERPYTFSELRTLFSIDSHRNIISDKGVDVFEAIKTIRPLLSIYENVVRIRHIELQQTIKTLIRNGKVSMPIKDGELDLLLRTVTYTNLVLKDRREPSLEDYELGYVNQLYNRHQFLDYAIRYWAVHLQQSVVFPKKGTEFALTADLKKVLPTTPVLAILEKLCWEAEFPTPQAVDLHSMVGRFRLQALTEKSPIVLQTYIVLARYYDHLSKHNEACKYYYLATKISRTVLSEFHAVTVECATRFITITESMTFTSRTEIVTFKEEILIIIIKAYQRQYGAASKQVIQMQTLLAELYTAIHEEERATKVYIEIREATIDIYGTNSVEARGVSDTLNIVLGKGRKVGPIDTYKGRLFEEEEEIEIVKVVEIAQIAVLLARIEQYIKEGHLFKAEQLYIELWQQVSSRCRTTRSVEWHEKNIQIALSYANFLKVQKRETETTAIVISVWKEYQHHELSFAETIISQLTGVAKFMKSTGQLTTALAIFKHASSYFKSVRKEETKFSSEIEEEISETSLEVVKRSLSSTTTTETTTTVSQSTFKSVFHSIISNTSKKIDSTTMTLSKRLTLEYMEKHEYSEAISIIKTTFQRTWSSFFAESVQSVTLTSEFLAESVYLAERLAECYLHLKQLDKVEDVYVRLFRATLVAKKTDELFEKTKWLLVNFYDKYGFPDKAIGVFQEVLVVYKKILGVNHTLTIQTLYILGSRCRSHARNHSYWIEYYLQILSILNKDSEVCHKDAIDAIFIVATYYWEDRRYAEAITVYTVIWATFVSKTKEYKAFTIEQTVKETYERYIQCLEESRTELETLHKISTQYRQTCIQAFGASASITTEATLSLAKISQRSETYRSEAISLYEEVTKSTTTTTTTKSELKETLLKLYKKQMSSKSTTSVSTETIDRAVSIHVEQYAAAKSTYGYTSMTTLSHMQELFTLYARQSKTDLIIKETSTAVTEIVTKETSSQKLLQYATFIAETFQACRLESHCTELIEELHCQIIAKHVRAQSKFSFNLTSCTRSSLAFIAGLQYHLRTDFQLTFSEIMADLIYESFHYDHVRRLLKADEALDKLIIAAAPLRIFLVKKKHIAVATLLEGDIVALFLKRDSAKLKLRSQASSRIFILSILDYFGQHSNVLFVRAVIQSCNAKVEELLKQKKFVEAYDVAGCGFLFAVSRKGYNDPKAISQGFKLAILLAGYGLPEAQKCQDQTLRADMLQLSNRIIREILDICKEKDVNFAKVQLDELNQLIGLLGEQKDYQRLEGLLTTLWNTREAQRSWPALTLLYLGRRLICARFLAGHFIQALRLCEDIAYNMRRVHGIRHTATLETYELLSQLYTSVGTHYQQAAAAGDKSATHLANQYFKKALLVHEDLLRTLTYDGTADEDDDDDDAYGYSSLSLSQHGGSLNGSVASLDFQAQGGDSQNSHRHLPDNTHLFESSDFIKAELRQLKLAYQRLGSWPKSSTEYTRLNKDLFGKYGGGALKGSEGVEKWSTKGFGAGKAESPDGGFITPNSWGFVVKQEVEDEEL